MGTTTRATIVILAALFAFGPIAVDTYLPAFPEIGRDLGASTTAVQMTLTSCLLGLALGQFIGGAMSDSLGRRAPLLTGVAGFAIISLACALAPSVWVLIVLRFVQGLGGGVGIGIAQAVVRDRYEGAAVAHVFSAMTAVTGLAPILAPLIGAFVLHVVSWRGIFALLAVAGAAILASTLVGLPESLPVERRHGGDLRTTARVFRRLTHDRSFVAPALAAGLPFGAMFAYVSGSPFVLQELYGLSPEQFGLVFGANALGIVSASLLGARLVMRVGPRALMMVGLVVGVAGGLSLLVVAITSAGLAPFLVALFLAIASGGLVGPNGIALALSNQPDAAGSASALIGVFPYVIGATVAPLVGLAGAASAMPLAIIIAALEITALALFLVLTRRPLHSAASA